MAEIMKQISYLGKANATLTVTFNDTPAPPPPTRPGGWPDYDLVRFNLTCSKAVEIKLWRTGNTPWREFTVPPGTYEYPAGGPVQKWSDITLVRLATA